jgi:hypothetical protein
MYDVANLFDTCDKLRKVEGFSHISLTKGYHC